MSTSKKRKTSWNDSYATEFGFIKRYPPDESKVFCTVCTSAFSISHGGRSDIVQHVGTTRHKNAIDVGSSSKKVSDFFKKISATKEELNISAKEAAIAYHTGRHNFSFRSNDCTSELIRACFEGKFTLGRTKTAAIIKRVIAPYIDEKIQQDIKRANFVCLMTDTSNHKNLKLLPVVLRYFNPVAGVVSKKIGLVSIPNEKSKTIADEFSKIIEEQHLQEKVIAFGADNTNFNFGGVDRNGQNNVWRHLQTYLNRQIIGNGCVAHIAHNASNAGCEILDIDMEALVVKIYKHFSLYTVRTETFKTFCEAMDESYKPLQKHSSTRFLTLEPAINRLIELYDPLKLYFLSLKKCPLTILRFFENPAGKFWILFVVNQLKNFNSTIKNIEFTRTTSFEAANEMTRLKGKIQNRKDFSFMPRESQLEYQKFNNALQVKIKKQISDFYEAIIDYIELWESPLDGSQIFMWMFMAKIPEWKEVDESFEYVADKYGDKIKSIIDRDILFDEYILMKSFIADKLSSYVDEELTVEKIWINIFTHFREQSTRLVNMEKCVEFAFSLPGTSCNVERIFSFINRAWKDEKNRFDVETISALLTIQHNSEVNCTQFYASIKGNVEFLEKIVSSDKYAK